MLEIFPLPLITHKLSWRGRRECQFAPVADCAQIGWPWSIHSFWVEFLPNTSRGWRAEPSGTGTETPEKCSSKRILRHWTQPGVDVGHHMAARRHSRPVFFTFTWSWMYSAEKLWNGRCLNGNVPAMRPILFTKPFWPKDACLNPLCCILHNGSPQKGFTLNAKLDSLGI